MAATVEQVAAVVAASTDAEDSGSAAAMLPHKEDFYGGVIIDSDHLPGVAADFTASLEASLRAWRLQGKRGVWLKVPIGTASYIALAVEHFGFKFHHAEEGYVMLTRWLPEDAPNTLPPNASHQVGVGAFVVNERREVLLVQERSGPLRGRAVWKMPTGLVHAGEDFVEAAEREVFEETGVAAKFDAVLAMRQAHGFAFGKSDLFVVCALKPESGQRELRPQESELVAACWMPIDEYRTYEFMTGVPLFDKMRERCLAYADGKYRGMRAERLASGVTKPRIDLLMWGGDDDSAATETAQEQQRKENASAL